MGDNSVVMIILITGLIYLWSLKPIIGVFVATSLIIMWAYREKKYISIFLDTIHKLASRTVQYSLALLTRVFIFVSFAMLSINMLFQKNYTLKDMWSFQGDAIAQFIALCFVLLMLRVLWVWINDVLNMVKQILHDVSRDATEDGIAYAIGVKCICVGCLLIYIAFFLNILLPLFRDGLMGNFSL